MSFFPKLQVEANKNYWGAVYDVVKSGSNFRMKAIEKNVPLVRFNYVKRVINRSY